MCPSVIGLPRVLAVRVARSPPTPDKSSGLGTRSEWCCERGVPWPFPCLEKHLVQIVSS